MAKRTLAELEIEEAKTEINPGEWKATLEDKKGNVAVIIVSVSNTKFILTAIGQFAKPWEHFCRRSFLFDDLN